MKHAPITPASPVVKTDAEYRAEAEADCAGKFLPMQMDDAIRYHIQLAKQFDAQDAYRARIAASKTEPMPHTAKAWRDLAA